MTLTYFCNSKMQMNNIKFFKNYYEILQKGLYTGS